MCSYSRVSHGNSRAASVIRRVSQSELGDVSETEIQKEADKSEEQAVSSREDAYVTRKRLCDSSVRCRAELSAGPGSHLRLQPLAASVSSVVLSSPPLFPLLFLGLLFGVGPPH